MTAASPSREITGREATDLPGMPFTELLRGLAAHHANLSAENSRLRKQVSSLNEQLGNHAVQTGPEGRPALLPSAQDTKLSATAGTTSGNDVDAVTITLIGPDDSGTQGRAKDDSGFADGGVVAEPAAPANAKKVRSKDNNGETSLSPQSMTSFGRSSFAKQARGPTDYSPKASKDREKKKNGRQKREHGRP